MKGNRVWAGMLCCFLALAACGGKTDPKTETLKNYLRTVHHTEISPSQKAIVVVSPNGCQSCIQRWTAAVLDQRQNENTVFLLTTAESVPGIDVARFSADSTKHVLYDEKDIFYDTGLLRTPGIIFLKEGRIDTIVGISGYELDNKLAFIKGKW